VAGIKRGMTPRYQITLIEEERTMLAASTRSGKTNAPKFIHARALLPLLCHLVKFILASRIKIGEIPFMKTLTAASSALIFTINRI
jgi:hypothetical protein